MSEGSGTQDDLRRFLQEQGNWVELGSADEQKTPQAGTVEARGRFGMYIPPLMETLGLAEVEHNPRNNRMRAT
jgi:hypothetical protein